MNNERGQPNSLINETSPYLLQHAYNPVDWRPWNPASLELARELDRPILLSIGYSACHWCHVMERESFEDPDTARVMNDRFVCIKVDREERPDLDKIYQLTHQMLNERPGGWPLTVALSPDTQAPFFAGTYFPDRPRHGLPAFKHVLARIADYFHSHRDELAKHAAAVKDALLGIEPCEAADPDPALHDRAVEELSGRFDEVDGGFGGAPKFPHPTAVRLCLDYGHDRHVDQGRLERALQMARRTLEAMASGGLYDQLGGGFYRYAVDKSWTIPHFEKMLYDNAQLLSLYVDAWRRFGDGTFRAVAADTASWVAAEMQSPDGGYYSTLDADSEGVEGKYYVWEPGVLKRLLTETEYAAVAARFGLDREPNFEGRWHLNVARGLDAVATRCALGPDQVRGLLRDAAHKLRRHRSTRIRPLCDDKILTSWNGLMIGAMARAGRVLRNPAFVSSAERALGFVQRDLWRDGRLLATARGGRAQLNAYLDDHVFLIEGILELCQARWRSADIDFAATLADAALDRFEDAASGGLYFTSDDHERLLHRTKPAADEATPSGNGVAARVLLRLGHLLGETRYLAAAERILRLLTGAAVRAPSAHGSLILAANEYDRPPSIIVIRGGPEGPQRWTEALQGKHLPGTMVVAVPHSAGPLPGILVNLEAPAQTTAYVCRGTSCSPPITSIEELEDRVETSNV
jgi:uncharacterized protein YyaL (SSP411 family)